MIYLRGKIVLQKRLHFPCISNTLLSNQKQPHYDWVGTLVSVTRVQNLGITEHSPAPTSQQREPEVKEA